MTTIRNKAGDVIRRSRNLRGMLRYASEVSPARFAHYAGETLTVTYCDGSVAVSPYAQADIAGHFLAARRSWLLEAISGEIAFVIAYRERRPC